MPHGQEMFNFIFFAFAPARTCAGFLEDASISACNWQRLRIIGLHAIGLALLAVIILHLTGGGLHQH